MDWQLKKSSSKANLNQGSEKTSDCSRISQKLVAVVVTIVVLAAVFVLLWMIDPALVEIFGERLEMILPMCLNYYMRS